MKSMLVTGCVAVVAAASGCATGGVTHAHSATHAPESISKVAAVSLSWLGHGDGWMLASRPCEHGKQCDAVYRTTDSGVNWQRRSMPALAAHHGGEVSAIAFTRVGVGYLFGTTSWVTRDFARTWQRISGRHTEALAIDGRHTFRIAYRHTGCPGPCNPVVQRARTGSTRWVTVYRSGPRGGFPDGGQLSVSGHYALATFPGNPAGGAPNAQTTYLESRDSGMTWARRADPCGGRVRDEWDSVVVSMNAADQSAVCERRQHVQSTAIVSSTDGGRHFTARRATPFKSVGAITQSDHHRLLVGSVAEDGQGAMTFRVAATIDRGRHWQELLTDRARAANTPVTALQCVVNNCAYLENPHHVFVSLDGGRTWRDRAV
jgi:photosystem II stability/assembly factor-like uncharacterized protein